MDTTNAGRARTGGFFSGRALAGQLYRVSRFGALSSNRTDACGPDHRRTSAGGTVPLSMVVAGDRRSFDSWPSGPVRWVAVRSRDRFTRRPAQTRGEALAWIFSPEDAIGCEHVRAASVQTLPSKWRSSVGVVDRSRYTVVGCRSTPERSWPPLETEQRSNRCRDKDFDTSTAQQPALANMVQTNGASRARIVQHGCCLVRSHAAGQRTCTRSAGTR
jgi:hypothetical protein